MEDNRREQVEALEVLVDKDAFNEKILPVGVAVRAKDDAKLAEVFEAVLPYFEGLGEAAAEVIQ